VAKSVWVLTSRWMAAPTACASRSSHPPRHFSLAVRAGRWGAKVWPVRSSSVSRSTAQIPSASERPPTGFTPRLQFPDLRIRRMTSGSPSSWHLLVVRHSSTYGRKLVVQTPSRWRPEPCRAPCHRAGFWSASPQEPAAKLQNTRSATSWFRGRTRPALASPRDLPRPNPWSRDLPDLWGHGRSRGVGDTPLGALAPSPAGSGRDNGDLSGQPLSKTRHPKQGWCCPSRWARSWWMRWAGEGAGAPRITRRGFHRPMLMPRTWVVVPAELMGT